MGWDAEMEKKANEKWSDGTRESRSKPVSHDRHG